MQPPDRVLLIQIRRLGDVVLSTALVEDLRAALPGAAIDFMVGKQAASLLMHNPHIRHLVPFRADSIADMLRDVKSRSYDWIIDVQAHPRTALVTWLSGVPVRVGWDARFWGNAYTHRTRRDIAPAYTVRDRERLLELVGIQPRRALPVLYVSDAEREQGLIDCSAIGLSHDRPIIGLAVASNDPERDWSIAGFASVASSLEQQGMQPLVFRFPGDDANIAQFRSHTDAGKFAEWNGDRRFLGLLLQCAALISPNTGPAHMATAVGVPRLTLYGSTNPVTWSPDTPIVESLTNPRQPCLGCRKKPCPVDRACIRGIEASEVLTALANLLARTRDLRPVRNTG